MFSNTLLSSACIPCQTPKVTVPRTVSPTALQRGKSLNRADTFSQVLAQHLPQMRPQEVRPSALTLPWQEVSQETPKQSQHHAFKGSLHPASHLQSIESEKNQFALQTTRGDVFQRRFGQNQETLTTQVPTAIKPNFIAGLTHQSGYAQPQPLALKETAKVGSDVLKQQWTQQGKQVMGRLRMLGGQLKEQTLNTVVQSWQTVTSSTAGKALLLPLQPSIAALSVGGTDMKTSLKSTSLTTTLTPSTLAYQPSADNMGVHLQPGHHLIQPETVHYAQSYGQYHAVGHKLNIVG